MGYMMATKAMHKLGDISRDAPDLCWIEREEADAFVGNWITGYGFIEVRFPKATTRPLTPAERDKYDGMRVRIGDQPSKKLMIPESH